MHARAGVVCKCRDHKLQEVLRVPSTFGLDMARPHRLLDHRISFETKWQTAEELYRLGGIGHIEL
jgi:hypothetical protein